MATLKKVNDYDDQNIDASNFYQMPRHLLNSSVNSMQQKSMDEEEELDQMAELIMSQNQHLLDGDLDYIKAQIKE
jgi:hypothetical protein